MSALNPPPSTHITHKARPAHTHLHHHPALHLSHNQCNIRLEKGVRALCISYRLERGFYGESPGQIPQDFTYTIAKGHEIKVRTKAHVQCTQAPTCWWQHQHQSWPSEDWRWHWLVGVCVDLPQASVLTIILHHTQTL